MRICNGLFHFVAFIAFVTSFSIHRNKQSRTITEEEFRKLRIDLIKERLLMKLNMDSPPNLSQPIQSSFREIFEYKPKYNPNGVEQVENNFGETKILFPESISYETNSIFPSVSLSIKPNYVITAEEILLAELWFYKKHTANKRNYTITIMDIVPTLDKSLRKEIINSNEEISESKWVSVDVSNLIKTWHRTHHSSRKMEFSCNDCDPELSIPVSIHNDKRPFLKIFLKKKASSDRNKRSTTCTESNNSGCCKQSLFINFTDIGWDSWVIQPAGYMANYCRGNCLNDVDNFPHHHSTVIREFIKMKGTAATESNLTLCCSPSKMAPISLLYKNAEDSLVLAKQLDNMIVDECSCF